MTTNRISNFDSSNRPLGTYLKRCRARLDPTQFGISTSRRRTPGLRREEVAQRAGISMTWYTWLEQGRGGGPSHEVLGRIAKALLLTEVEREHLFMLAYGSAESSIPGSLPDDVDARLQRVVDAFVERPAYVKTQSWDLLAWNEAANAVFGYSGLARQDRNLLRRMFLSEETRTLVVDWEDVAGFVVSTFRRGITRASHNGELQELLAELINGSAEFKKLWLQHDVRMHGTGKKRLLFPGNLRLDLEYSAFGVDDYPDLTMVVFNPVTVDDARAIRLLLSRSIVTHPATKT